MEKLVLTLVRKMQEVELIDVAGVINKCTLRELTGTERDKYLSSMSSRMKYDAKGKPIGIKSFDGLQAALLERTLYDSDDNLVEKAVIQEYPSSTLQALYEASQKLSALDEKAEDDAKNASPASDSSGSE